MVAVLYMLLLTLSAVLRLLGYCTSSITATRQQQLVTQRPFTSIHSISGNLHYARSVGIGSGHRQLIAVTCIAEHA